MSKIVPICIEQIRVRFKAQYLFRFFMQNNAVTFSFSTQLSSFAN